MLTTGITSGVGVRVVQGLSRYFGRRLGQGCHRGRFTYITNLNKIGGSLLSVDLYFLLICQLGTQVVISV